MFSLSNKFENFLLHLIHLIHLVLSSVKTRFLTSHDFLGLLFCCVPTGHAVGPYVSSSSSSAPSAFLSSLQTSPHPTYVTALKSGWSSCTMLDHFYLKGYSSVNLIHGLNHRETVLDSLSRDQVSRPLINLRNDCTTTIHCSKWIQI